MYEMLYKYHVMSYNPEKSSAVLDMLDWKPSFRHRPPHTRPSCLFKENISLRHKYSPLTNVAMPYFVVNEQVSIITQTSYCDL